MFVFVFGSGEVGTEAGESGEDPVEADTAGEDLVVSGKGGRDLVVGEAGEDLVLADAGSEDQVVAGEDLVKASVIFSSWNISGSERFLSAFPAISSFDSKRLIKKENRKTSFLHDIKINLSPQILSSLPTPLYLKSSFSRFYSA